MFSLDVGNFSSNVPFMSSNSFNSFSWQDVFGVFAGVVWYQSNNNTCAQRWREFCKMFKRWFWKPQIEASNFFQLWWWCWQRTTAARGLRGQKLWVVFFWSFVPGSKLVVLGMVIHPLIGNPYSGYINPYYWVDDHPLLYGNNGSWSPDRTFRSGAKIGKWMFLKNLCWSIKGWT